ncbi:MAG: protein translocase subunit SecF [Methylotenera sp.]|nr:protein translocase subunit SecF [Oligoflexia bacterium]
MLHLIRPDLNIDFLKKSRPFVLLSTILAVASIIGLFTPGLNYGIDFTGGAEVQLRVPKDWDIAKLRSELDEGGLKDPSIVQIGDVANHEFLVKVQSTPEKLNQVSAQVSTALGKKLDPKAYEIVRTDVVGPQAGANLRMNALLSMLYAMLCIVVYITFRFDLRYAPGVVRALGVDVIITLGVWVLLRREFNLTVLASMLTVAGYSCNDTIVIYDRIRDYTKSHPQWTLEDSINRSINQNLGRTVLTVLCTLFVVVSLYLFGGPVLQDFALPMLIGFTISIPSTIFVANPMILYMEKRRLAKLAAAGPMSTHKATAAAKNPSNPQKA